MDFSVSNMCRGLGMLVGEAAHQADKLYEGTKEVVDSSWEDIKSIPDAIVEGYDEELFTADQKEEVKTKVIKTAVEIKEVIVDKVQEVQERVSKKFTTTPINNDVEA